MKTKNISLIEKPACLCQAKYATGRYNVNMEAHHLLCEKKKKKQKIIMKPPTATLKKMKDLIQRLQSVSHTHCLVTELSLQIKRNISTVLLEHWGHQPHSGL